MASNIATESSTTANVGERSSLRQNLEACMLDGFISEAGQHQKLRDYFRGISTLISKWHFFDSSDQIKDYLENNPNIKLITIMSGHFARTLLALISEIEALHSVYVFTINIDRTRDKLGYDPKLKGIFNTEDTLYDQIRKDLIQLFWDEGTRLAQSNHDSEARVYFDEVRRLSQH